MIRVTGSANETQDKCDIPGDNMLVQERPTIRNILERGAEHSISRTEIASLYQCHLILDKHRPLVVVTGNNYTTGTQDNLFEPLGLRHEFCHGIPDPVAYGLVLVIHAWDTLFLAGDILCLDHGHHVALVGDEHVGLRVQTAHQQTHGNHGRWHRDHIRRETVRFIRSGQIVVDILSGNNTDTGRAAHSEHGLGLRLHHVRCCDHRFSNRVGINQFFLTRVGVDELLVELAVRALHHVLGHVNVQTDAPRFRRLMAPKTLIVRGSTTVNKTTRDCRTIHFPCILLFEIGNNGTSL